MSATPPLLLRLQLQLQQLDYDYYCCYYSSDRDYHGQTSTATSRQQTRDQPSYAVRNTWTPTANTRPDGTREPRTKGPKTTDQETEGNTELRN